MNWGICPESRSENLIFLDSVKGPFHESQDLDLVHSNKSLIYHPYQSKFQYLGCDNCSNNITFGRFRI